MSDQDNNMMNVSDSFRLRMDVLGLMLKGAGYAALFVLGIWLFLTIVRQIGLMLPAESQEALDPTPLSFWLEAVQTLPFV